MRLFRGSLLCLFIAGSGIALGQYSNQPYFDTPDTIRHAHALALVEVRLMAMDAVAAWDEWPEEIAEQVENMLTEDLPRIAGSLHQVAPELHEELEGALRELAELARAGGIEAMRPVAQRVLELTMAAHQELIGDSLGRPPISAALMSRLLLGEPGVGEGYEEAVAGERWEYTLGWAALQRTKEIWAELSPNVSGRVAEVDEALAELDRLLPEPIPPQALSGDPEAAEEPAHRVTSLLEVIADANLYPGRELGRIAGLAADQATTACAAFAEGDEALGVELGLAVEDAYESISGTTAMLAGAAHERIERALTAFSGGNGLEGETEVGAGGADGQVEAVPLVDPVEACGHLQQGLEEIVSMFGG